MTKVVFRYDKKEDEVLAVFPEFVCHTCGCVLCYAHIGQHFEADYSQLISTTKLATETQYADLYSELEAIGYRDLKVVKRAKVRFN